MAFFSTLLEVVFILVIIFLCCNLTFTRKNTAYIPVPGPPGLPFIGNIHQIGKRPHLKFMEWMKTYGKMFRVRLGMDEAIVINDPKLIRELFSETCSTGRIQNAVFLAMSEGNYGIINAEGEHWESQRRFVLRTLRDFGFAKSVMEGMILEEVGGVLEWFGKNEGTAITCDRLFNGAVVNSLWHIVSGRRTGCGNSIPGKNSEILCKSNNLMKALEATSKTGLMYAPILRFFAPTLSGWTNLVKSVRELQELSEETIEQHKVYLNRTCPQDLIDHYLMEIEKANKDPTSSFFKTSGEKNLKAVVTDLFEAGNETTSTTLVWTLLYLSHHPCIQSKLIAEIRSVVGKSRLPALSDKVSLPYTEAVIMEVLRKSTLTPLGVMHRMHSDTVFHGYLLRKGTTIIPNIYASHHDPAVWGDPENFRPERWLSDDGQLVVRNEALIPFSAGRRACLGEALAKDTLFLFTVSIFQKFEVHPDPDNPKPDFEPEIGFINVPKYFRVVMNKI